MEIGVIRILARRYSPLQYENSMGAWRGKHEKIQRFLRFRRLPLIIRGLEKRFRRKFDVIPTGNRSTVM